MNTPRKENICFPSDSSGKKACVGTGQTPVKAIHEMLRDIIIGGQAKPSFIVNNRISFDEVPEAYREFDQRANGYTKVIIKPQKCKKTLTQVRRTFKHGSENESG